MNDDVLQIVLNKLEKIEKDISDIKAFQNRLIGMGIGLSAIFAFIFDVIKSLWSK